MKTNLDLKKMHKIWETCNPERLTGDQPSTSRHAKIQVTQIIKHMSFITALQNTENARVVGETNGFITYLLFNTSNYGLV